MTAFNPPRENRFADEAHFSYLTAFGSLTAVDLLEFFLGTPDIETNVRK